MFNLLDPGALMVVGIVLVTAGLFLGAFASEVSTKIRDSLSRNEGEGSGINPLVFRILGWIVAGIGIAILVWGVITSG